MLISLNKILRDAENKKYAVPAFNTYNMETTIGVIEAAKEKKSPVIIQVYSRLFSENSAYYLSPVILAAAQEADVPVAFHIDHSTTILEISRALRYGCNSAMFDASKLSIEENIEKTREIVKLCRNVGVPVEGELGHVGSTKDEIMDEFTDAGEAKRFVDETGVTSLAIMVGTAHGRYKKEPKLDIERIKAIHEATPAYLVLHGGSGVPDTEIKEAIQAGITKINFATDICYAFIDKIFETDRNIVAVDLFMKDAINSVKEFAVEKIELLGSDNRA